MKSRVRLVSVLAVGVKVDAEITTSIWNGVGASASGTFWRMELEQRRLVGRQLRILPALARHVALLGFELPARMRHGATLLRITLEIDWTSGPLTSGAGIAAG
jgi:hypothetical protein